MYVQSLPWQPWAIFPGMSAFPMLRARVLMLVSGVVLAGCAQWHAAPGASVGLPSSGWLVGGTALPDRGRGFVRGRPGEATRFGTERLVSALTHAASVVAQRWPDGEPLRIGDLSAPSGGEHERHASHRTGRDADLVFYLTSLDGRSVAGRAHAFDRHGIARDDSGALVRFDVARNWELVRTLLLDEHAQVQWIFCSHGIKSLLLRYAARHERDPDALARATWVLHQPSRGRPHDDHFHVRVLCSPEDVASGCHDHGPRWTWLRAGARPLPPEPHAGDSEVLAWMRQDADEASERDALETWARIP